MHLLTVIEAHLRRTATPPTRFGREAVRDPQLVYDMRRGRSVGLRVAKRIIAHLESQS